LRTLLVPFLLNVPLFLPGVALSVALGYLARRRAATWLRIPDPLGWATIVALGVILSATLTPLHSVAETTAATASGCDLSRFGLAPLDDLLKPSDVSLNVVLFIPLGLVLGWIPWSSHKALAIGLAAALPIMIEGIQLLVTPLDRGCESADVFDNLTGLVIGLATGFVARRL
jgi:glycopeptide antibiotics resistance protein